MFKRQKVSQSCLSLCSSQETVARIPHDVGALMFFVFGVSYIILQSIISCKAFPYGCSKTVCRVRWVFAIIAAVALVPSILSVKSVKIQEPSVLFYYTDFLTFFLDF